MEPIKQLESLNHDFIDEVIRDGMVTGDLAEDFAFLDENLFPELESVPFEELTPTPLEPTEDYHEMIESQQMTEFFSMQPLDANVLIPVPVVPAVPDTETIAISTETTLEAEAIADWYSSVTIEIDAPEEEQVAVEKTTGEPSMKKDRKSSEPPKKRGRKPLYPPGTVRPRRRRPKKVKLYELGTLEDPEMEKKRQNALNAKIHREKQKERKEALVGQLDAAIRDRDELRRQLEEMREREKKLIRELELVRQQHITPALPVKITV